MFVWNGWHARFFIHGNRDYVGPAAFFGGRFIVQPYVELAILGASTGVVLFTPEGHENRSGTSYPASSHCVDIDAALDALSARGVQFPTPQTRQP